jgi:hypothetical protein
MMHHMGGFDDQGDVERQLDRLCCSMRLDNNQEGVEEYRMMIEQQRRRQMVGERHNIIYRKLRREDTLHLISMNGNN